MLVASITGQLTSWIGSHGIYAVFALMALDALLPVGGELIMVYAGALGAGAFAGQHVAFFGAGLSTGLESYVALALAGGVGYLLGSVVGWGVGAWGGRPLLERRGRWLHVTPANLARAEDWFARFGDRAVFIGRLTPVVRSFISIPAGALGARLRSYVPLTLAGSLIWCFAFAAAGWALGSNYESFHHAFAYADVVAVAGVVLLAGVALRHRRMTAKPG